MKPLFTINESGCLRIAATRIEFADVRSISPNDCIARLISISAPRQISPDSRLGTALREDAPSEVIDELVKSELSKEACEIETLLDVGFLIRNELEGSEIQLVDGIEFCMPSAMYEAFRGWKLVWQETRWELVELAAENVPGSK